MPCMPDMQVCAHGGEELHIPHIICVICEEAIEATKQLVFVKLGPKDEKQQ